MPNFFQNSSTEFMKMLLLLLHYLISTESELLLLSICLTNLPIYNHFIIQYFNSKSRLFCQEVNCENVLSCSPQPFLTDPNQSSHLSQRPLLKHACENFIFLFTTRNGIPWLLGLRQNTPTCFVNPLWSLPCITLQPHITFSLILSVRAILACSSPENRPLPFYP